MAFTKIGTWGDVEAPILQSAVIANSVTITEQHSVKLASGFVALGTAGAVVYGHVVGLRTYKGVGLLTTGAAGAEIGSFVGTFTTASDNQTVDQVKAEVDVSKFTLYSADPDATVGTTTGSDLPGYFTDIASASTTDESTAATTAAQYAIHGLDPKDSGNHVVSIFESVLFGPLA